MTAADWFVAYVTIGFIAIITLFYVTARMARQDGYEAGRVDERDLHHQRARQAAQRPPTQLLARPYVPGRHAEWVPRLTITRDASVTLESARPSSLTMPIGHARRTDTGELRGLTAGGDAWIDNMRRQEEQFRTELANW